MRFIYTVTQRVEEIMGDEIGEGDLEVLWKGFASHLKSLDIIFVG